eukprot:4041285-Pyramimonas_sp.AAC.1
MKALFHTVSSAASRATSKPSSSTAKQHELRNNCARRFKLCTELRRQQSQARQSPVLVVACRAAPMKRNIHQEEEEEEEEEAVVVDGEEEDEDVVFEEGKRRVWKRFINPGCAREGFEKMAEA